jgi:hypothetical protein
MEPIIIPFTRGGMPFEAQITNANCIIRDLTTDARFGMGYKLEIREFTCRTKCEDQQASITVRYRFGLETTPGAIVNVSEGSWSFGEDHPDLGFFQAAFGQAFMGSCVNGFVKHRMPIDPRYSESGSAFLRVLDDSGAYLPGNND